LGANQRGNCRCERELKESNGKRVHSRRERERRNLTSIQKNTRIPITPECTAKEAREKSRYGKKVIKIGFQRERGRTARRFNIKCKRRTHRKKPKGKKSKKHDSSEAKTCRQKSTEEHRGKKHLSVARN